VAAKIVPDHPESPFESSNLWRPHATVDAEGVDEHDGFARSADLVEQTSGSRARGGLGTGTARQEKKSEENVSAAPNPHLVASLDPLRT
jgi:hypothetical protein